MTEIFTASFDEAAEDYLFLLDRGYPEKETVKLVGNRYGLTGPQRMVLYRGVAPTEKAAARKTKLIGDPGTQPLHMDGYNVLCTIMNYLSGKPVFIANDGLMRDVGGEYGKIETPSMMDRAMDLLVDAEVMKRAARVTVYLDEPVSGSGEHAEKLKEKMLGKGTVLLVKSADEALMAVDSGVIVTSDSEIIDAAGVPVYDLGHQLIAKKFKTKIVLATDYTDKHG